MEIKRVKTRDKAIVRVQMYDQTKTRYDASMTAQAYSGLLREYDKMQQELSPGICVQESASKQTKYVKPVTLVAEIQRVDQQNSIDKFEKRFGNKKK